MLVDLNLPDFVHVVPSVAGIVSERAGHVPRLVIVGAFRLGLGPRAKLLGDALEKHETKLLRGKLRTISVENWSKLKEREGRGDPKLSKLCVKFILLMFLRDAN